MKKISQVKLNYIQRHILVVDDESQICMFVGVILDGHGYEVTHCTNSVEALDIFSKNPYMFDLVLTDQNMPKMSGLELVKKMHAIRENIPVILFTGHDVDEVKASTIGVNIAGYINKPLQRQVLLNEIAEHLSVS